MDWRQLAHNRWVWIGGGVAAAAGLYTWYRRRKSGGTSSGTSSSSPYASGLTADQIASGLNSLPVDSSAPANLGSPDPSTPPVTGNPKPSQVTVTAPANANLYNWSQSIEKQYGLTTPLFNQLSGYTWGPAGAYGSDPQYGRVPYFASATPVTVVLPQ